MAAKTPSPPEPRRPPRGPVTVAELIAQGPRFYGTPGLCQSCGEPGPVDRETLLCRPCWRCYRWSMRAPMSLEAEPGWSPPDDAELSP